MRPGLRSRLAQRNRARSRNPKPHKWGFARPGWRCWSCGRDAGRLGVVRGESSLISCTEQCSSTSSWSLLRSPQLSARGRQSSFWRLTGDAHAINPWVHGDVHESALATAFLDTMGVFGACRTVKCGLVIGIDHSPLILRIDAFQCEASIVQTRTLG